MVTIIEHYTSVKTNNQENYILRIQNMRIIIICRENQDTYYYIILYADGYVIKRVSVRIVYLHYPMAGKLLKI